MISLISPSEVKNNTSIAIGSFDGLHEGHRKLIERVVKETKYTPTVASFWPHPREVLYRETRLRLDLPKEKLPLLESLGIEQLVLIPFDINLSRLKPEVFVKNILLNQLRAKSISVGANFQFGYKRSGDINTIKNIIINTDTKLNIVPILNDNEGRISSSRVRELLQKSDLYNAEQLLKRPYSFSGKVVRGKGLGKKIGCPTANLEIDGRKFLPGEGVYAAWTICKELNKSYKSVMNLGSQPTVDPLLPSAVEVHLIDEEINLYDLELRVQPVKKFRSQIKFSSLDELSKQIYKDKETAKKFLKAFH
ncbi:MAG: bifunctional riboflavin kinase/FMN adenylyltransferase [Prochlorococcus sp. SP3034]|nr:bifunctional riboflavin kinase/FMN adenylyltransferase [Prochlorococcus sp. SP3034]